MIDMRTCAILATALLAAGCAETPDTGSVPAMRFDTAPMEFSRNPKMTAKLNQTFSTNESDLSSIAERIEQQEQDTADAIEALAALEDDAPEVAAPKAPEVTAFGADTSLY